MLPKKSSASEEIKSRGGTRDRVSGLLVFTPQVRAYKKDLKNRTFPPKASAEFRVFELLLSSRAFPAGCQIMRKSMGSRRFPTSRKFAPA